MSKQPAMWLLVVAGMLGLVLLVEFWRGEQSIAAIEAPYAAPVRTAAESREAVQDSAVDPDEIAGWLRVALARPLMTVARKPAASGGGPAISLAGGLPRLAGTLTDTDRSVAIFARDDGGKPVVVAQGAALGPWRVTRIAPNSVTLEGPSGRQVLHPSFGKGTPADVPGTTMPGMPAMQPGLNFPGLVPPNLPGRLQNMPPG